MIERAPRARAPEDDATARALLGARLREARLQKGVGVRQLGREVECSASLISQIELGRVAPSESTLYALASVLGISMDSFFDAGTEETTRLASVARRPASRPSRQLAPSAGPNERAFV